MLSLLPSIEPFVNGPRQVAPEARIEVGDPVIAVLDPIEVEARVVGGDVAGEARITALESAPVVTENQIIRVVMGYDGTRLRVWRGRVSRIGRDPASPGIVRIDAHQDWIDVLRKVVTTTRYDESYAGADGLHTGKWLRSDIVKDLATIHGIPISSVEASERLVTQEPFVQKPLADVIAAVLEPEFLKARFDPDNGGLVVYRGALAQGLLVEDLSRDFGDDVDIAEHENLTDAAGQIISAGGGTTTVTLTGTMNAGVVAGTVIKFVGFAQVFAVLAVAGNILTLDANAPPNGTAVEYIRATEVANGVLRLTSASNLEDRTARVWEFDDPADVATHENIGAGHTVVAGKGTTAITLDGTLDARVVPGVLVRLVGGTTRRVNGVTGNTLFLEARSDGGPGVEFIRGTEVLRGEVVLSVAASAPVIDVVGVDSLSSDSCVAQKFQFASDTAIGRIDVLFFQPGGKTISKAEIRRDDPTGLVERILYDGPPHIHLNGYEVFPVEQFTAVGGQMYVLKIEGDFTFAEKSGGVGNGLWRAGCTVETSGSLNWRVFTAANTFRPAA